mgnify:CR=1 FL=1|jgi:hypothetical protein
MNFVSPDNLKRLAQEEFKKVIIKNCCLKKWQEHMFSDYISSVVPSDLLEFISTLVDINQYDTKFYLLSSRISVWFISNLMNKDDFSTDQYDVIREIRGTLASEGDYDEEDIIEYQILGAQAELLALKSSDTNAKGTLLLAADSIWSTPPREIGAALFRMWEKHKKEFYSFNLVKMLNSLKGE